MDDNRRSRYVLIGSLYVSQAIPLGFFILAMPAILRSRGVSLENVGLFSALALPFLVKFLWAPLVDRYGSARRGHYRSWILPLQSLTVLCVLGIAALDPEGQIGPLALAGGLFMLLAATQDVATDGLSVHILSVAERGPGNGIQVGGYYLGQVLGGGVILIVFERFGWTVALLAMAAFLALPLLPALRFREPQHREGRPARTDYRALGRFFTRPGNGPWIAILTLFRAGEAMAVTMVSPMLVDHGYSLQQIAILLGMAGSLAALAGATLGGTLLRRVGRKPSLILFGLLQSTAIGGFVLPAAGWGAQSTIFTIYAVVMFTGGMATTALYTSMMDRCEPRTAATDFSLQQSLAAVGPILAASFSGFSAAGLGYAGHFVAAMALNLAAVGIVALWLVRPVDSVTEETAEIG